MQARQVDEVVLGLGTLCFLTNERDNRTRCEYSWAFIVSCYWFIFLNQHISPFPQNSRSKKKKKPKTKKKKKKKDRSFIEDKIRRVCLLLYCRLLAMN